MTLTEVLTILNILFAILIPTGAFVALRSGFAKAAQEAEARVRAALTEENTLLRRRVEKLEQVIETLTRTFEKRGVRIEINGETITLIEGPRASTVQIRIEKPEE